MPMHPDTRFNDPFLNDAFDFSRYPTLKTMDAKSSTKLYNLRPPVHGRVGFLAYSKPGSPPSPKAMHPRNVSEPQLVSSTNYMRESWFTNFASTRTVGNIAHLFSDDDVLPAINHSHGPTATGSCLHCEDDDDQLQKTLRTVCEVSSDVSEFVEPSGYTSEEDSFYSMDSADQDAHPLLLSIPIIPKIKLERKATLRNPDPGPLFEATQNQSFLSPRIRDLRTPARMSSRRHGRILPRTGPPAIASDGTQASSHDYSSPSFATRAQQSRTKLAYVRSVSEPILNAAYRSDNEEEPLLKKDASESPHSGGSPSVIDEVDLSPGSNSDLRKSIPPKHSKRGHHRSSVTSSISFSNIIHAVADGCASLDQLLRNKSKPKPKPAPKFYSHELANAHDPTSKWAAKHGQIVIKVFVPSADDIWMFRVPQDINLADFTSRVVSKLGFSVSFSGSLWDEPRYYFRTDDQFKAWVKGRVRFRRNLPIVAHVPPPLPFVRLSMEEDGCEVWCYS